MANQEVLPPEPNPTQVFGRDGHGKFKTGHDGGPGRPAGVPNEMTRQLKTVVLEALDKISGGDGGVGYLMGIAITKPEVFCRLVGQVLPLKIEGGVQVQITAITRRVISDDNGT